MNLATRFQFAIAIGFVIFLCTGCTSSPESADLKMLSGDVPQCRELASDERRAYRVTAFRVCNKAKTFDERIKSIGCFTVERISECMGHDDTRNYSLEQSKAEEEEGLRPIQ